MKPREPDVTYRCPTCHTTIGIPAHIKTATVGTCAHKGTPRDAMRPTQMIKVAKASAA